MRKAIVSVSDKEDITELSNFLLGHGFMIYSTGGTYRAILDGATAKGISTDNLQKVSDLTGFPEILSGRVKTLHPHIYAGLLSDSSNETHQAEMKELGLDKIDLVVCNLYPFVSSPSIETIDIGGVTLLRAGSKNYKDVVVLSSPSQYGKFMTKITNGSDVLGYNESERKCLAEYAFSSVSEYDNQIAKFMGTDKGKIQLKYGMNPHQSDTEVVFEDGNPFTILNGTLGMINIIDIIHGWLTVKEIDNVLDLPCAISMKHTSLAGLAVGIGINEITLNYYNLSAKDMDNVTPVSIAYMKSRLSDPLSSFGDFICISREVDAFTAKLIKMEITDGIAAPSYTDDALEILMSKKSGQFKIIQMNEGYYDEAIVNGWTETKSVYGITLRQKNNAYINDFKEISDEQTRIDHVLANSALKYAQSNNISLAVDGQIIGIGCGQQNRVGCVKLAGDKALNWVMRQSKQANNFWTRDSMTKLKRQEKVNLLYDHLEEGVACDRYSQYSNLTKYPIVMASDGFFPFIDNIKRADIYGVKYVIHPGGSIRDEDIKTKCEELGIGLTITGTRMFYH
jgi:phosphoribosylaminoimidazolecarboxamide formyltransferase / IMP cyclohydrolase